LIRTDEVEVNLHPKLHNKLQVQAKFEHISHSELSATAETRNRHIEESRLFRHRITDTLNHSFINCFLLKSLPLQQHYSVVQASPFDFEHFSVHPTVAISAQCLHPATHWLSRHHLLATSMCEQTLAETLHCTSVLSAR
jgi:hypothetical protein